MSLVHSLAKQKRRLSMLFSLSIFLVIVILDIGFLSFRYFDYERQELGRLTFQSQGIINILRENPNVESDLLQGKGFLIGPNGMRHGGMVGNGVGRSQERRGIQENFFLYNIHNEKILFSQQKDDELYSSLLQSILSNGGKTFELGEDQYYFLNSPLTENISAVFFTESRMTDETILMDMLIYFGGAILLSLIIYIISIRFVDNTLAPVEKSINDMEQFIHNAGHELKTPISVIKSSLELMRLKKNYDEGITESIGELDRMNGLIQALIRLSSLDEGHNVERINMQEILEKLQKNYSEKLQEKNISLEIITKKIPPLRANREYAEILFSNLLSNAIKYNKNGGKITITIEEKSIKFEDTGRGIKKQNIGKIFDRFYQESSSRDENSFGIGLSLVEHIASINKWTVFVESEEGKGTLVTIKF